MLWGMSLEARVVEEAAVEVALALGLGSLNSS